MAVTMQQCSQCYRSYQSLRSYATAATKQKPMAKKTYIPKSKTPYPYGPARHYKQRDSGLYGRAKVMYGHSRTERKVKKFDDVSNRSWHLNVHRKRVWSNSLDKFVRLKIQIGVLRTIDKVGGLDNYILGEKPARIKQLGMRGWDLKQEILRTPAIRTRIKEERKRLGLPRATMYDQEKRLRRRLEWMARTMSDKYVRAVDTTPREGEDFEENALLDPKRYPEEATHHFDLANENADLVQMSLNERLTYHANTINTLAVDIAADACSISPLLPLPDLRSAQHSISLLPLLKDAERSLPLRAPEEYLLRSIEQVARKLSVPVSTLLASARSRLAETESRQRARSFARYAKTHRLPGPVITDRHVEIDDAIESGDVLPVYNEYLARQSEVRQAYNEDRARRRQELAQKHYGMLRTSNAKGGKGVYKKKSGWHDCFMKANKEVGRKATEEFPPPEGLTKGQWGRLLAAGRLAEGRLSKGEGEAPEGQLEGSIAGAEGVRTEVTRGDEGSKSSSLLTILTAPINRLFSRRKQ